LRLAISSDASIVITITPKSMQQTRDENIDDTGRMDGSMTH
jgi:hypothetical protein